MPDAGGLAVADATPYLDTSAAELDPVSLALVAGDELQPIEPPRADKNPARVYLGSLSEGSRRAMQGALSKITHLLTGGRCDTDTMPWGRVRWQHTNAVRAVVASRYAVRYARKVLAALRGVLKVTWRLGYMSSDDYQRAVDIGPVRGTPAPFGRALTSGEVRALFTACAESAETGNTPTAQLGAARDAAVLALLFGAGLRRSEIIALEMRDLNESNGELQIRKGKGNKFRNVYLAPGGLDAIQAWLQWRGRAAGPLLRPMTRGGRLLNRGISDQTIQDVLARRVRQAGIAHASPHDGRRTFITDVNDASRDLVATAKIVGHSNINETAQYTRQTEEAKQRAVQSIHLPYVKPRERRA